MSFWTEARVRRTLELSGSGDIEFTSVSTDSRSVEPGALFVALTGERFDGHSYLNDVANKGARGAVVTGVPSDAPAGLTYYVVADTLQALGRLGRERRRTLAARVCAVTGSNGKTTTKEMLKAVLGTKYVVHATSGNLNNLIGTPLTLLAAPDNAEVLVVELGTSVPGEIAQLGAIVEPDAAVVTGISEEHLEGLGDLQGVLKEETAILHTIKPDGFAVIADEPPELGAEATSVLTNRRALHVAGWSERADADLRARDVSLDENGDVHFYWNNTKVHVPLRGRHNARNALLALGIAREWGVDLAEAIGAMARLKPARMRGELHSFGAMTVIADCYNSNPASLASAIDLLESLPQKRRRVAVVGSMLELGPTSGELHERAAQQIADAKIDLIVATGLFVPAFAGLKSEMGNRLVLEQDPVAAWSSLEERLQGDELVLLKGSRGVALERLLPHLEAFGSAPPPRGGLRVGGEESAHRGAQKASAAEHSHD